jgi:1-acyl-sn-glycerol-3-phosphate acyltransferase
VTPFYRMAWTICRIVFKILWRFKATGAENVPRTGPVIVASNHLSYLDPVAVGIGLPRMVTYLAKKELFEIPVLSFFVRGCGAYPLDREAGGVAAVRAALRVLKAGRCIGIFPEGTRNLAGAAAEKGGAAFLAALSGAPVVPCAVAGTKDAKRFARIRVVYGKPMVITRNRKADSDDLEKWTAEIMRSIHVLEESIGGK